MLSYSWVATLLSNFEYWRLFSLIESGTNPSNLVGIILSELRVSRGRSRRKRKLKSKDLPILLVLMNLRQKIPVSGRFFNKK